MKKLLYIIICLITIFTFLFTYNFKENNKVNNINLNTIEDNIQEIIEDKYIHNNPIIVGLYKYYGSNKNRELITEYTNTWEYHKDISSFEVYYTTEKEITGKNQINTFNLYKDNYTNVDNYRIGYIVEFSTTESNYSKTILRPKDTEDFYEYLEIYLYDDYHRTGGWYSHTTDNEFNDNTLLTSIKLTAGKKINNITTPIKVTAFTYDNDDFDDDNNYIGKSKYQITVNKK